MEQASIALLIILASIFCCARTEEKFTLVSSRTIQHGSRYGVYVDTSRLDYGTTITMKLHGQKSVTHRTETRTESQEENHQNVIEFNLDESRLANDYKLAVLSHRDGMCAYDEIPIFPVRKEYSVFVQMDRAIYKPKDVIQFRVVMIDEQTRPFQPRSLQVKIRNANGDNVKEFAVRDNDINMGIYQNKFIIPEHSRLGEWNLSVTVNGRENEIITKSFEVKKQILPLINVNIESKSYLFHTDSMLNLTLSAKYSIDMFAKGSAVVKVKVYDNDRIVKKSVAKNITIEAETRVNFDIVNELKIKPTDPDRIIQIVVDFTDELSREKFTKVREISLRHKDSFNIKIYNPKTFSPGSLYEFYASVRDIEGIPQDTKSYPVTMRCKYSNDNFQVIHPSFLEKGFAKFSWFVPDYVQSLNITVNHRDSNKNFLVERGTDEKNDNFEATILTKQPSLKEDVKVQLKSVHNIGTVSYAVAGRLGLADAGNFECHSESCELSITPNDKMLPDANLIVYYVNVDGDVIYDTTKLHFHEISSNYLNMKADRSSTKPGSHISLNLESAPNSLIALLGIDESLAHQKTGYDIESSDISQDLLTFGHTDFIIKHSKVTLVEKSFVYFQNFQDLHPCTNDEKDLLKEQDNRHHSKRSISGDDNNEPSIRRDFREVFLFDTATTDQNGRAAVDVQMPDKISKWLISGFAMNDENGFALAEPLKITTEKELFIQLNLNHSIKTYDVVEIDVTVISLIASQSSTNVDVTLLAYDGKQQYFDFIEHANTRNPQSIRQNEMTKSISIPQNSARKTFFHIRVQKPGEIKIKVKAKSSEASDEIEQTLIVEYKPLPTIPTTPKPAPSPRYRVDRNFFEYVVPTQNDSHYEQFTKCAINVQVYKLLKERNLLTSELSSYGVYYINLGYTYLLHYRTEDGSFSYANNFDGRIWTTAFVAKLLGQIREIIQIDDNYIIGALDYLASQQGGDGEYGMYNAKVLKFQDVTMTAFVMTAFLENFHLTRGRYNKAIHQGIVYIYHNVNYANSNYATAISAYAFALANRISIAESLLTKLNDNAINAYNVKYWTNRGTVCHTLPNCIEITAYALLAHAKMNKLDEGIKVENWLIGKKAQYGREDMIDGTILSLNALSEFAKLGINEVVDETYKKSTTERQEATTTRAQVKSTSRVTHHRQPEKTTRRSVNNQNVNKIAKKMQDTNDDNGNIQTSTFRATNLQAARTMSTTTQKTFTSYNTQAVNEKQNDDEFIANNRSSINSVETDATTNSNTAETENSNNCRVLTEKNVTKNFNVNVFLVSNDNNTFNIKVCANLIPGSDVNSTMMEIQTPSGCIIDKVSNLSGQNLVDFAGMRIEDEDTKAKLFFNSFTTTEVCTILKVLKLTEPGNGQKGIINIHDHNDAEKQSTIFYTIKCGD